MVFNDGISAIHGGHQVAHKLMKITRPLWSAVLMVLPSGSTSERVGARLAGLACSVFSTGGLKSLLSLNPEV
ncbi:hypothetical protein [Mucilaginibacter antarcticus]|uniref:hypothetical protein n=1 Tax=Mucilaginibacter antarcticus TaxID=1855725 RepID=UPI003639B06E